jgi:hypothetical protein
MVVNKNARIWNSVIAYRTFPLITSALPFVEQLVSAATLLGMPGTQANS